MLSKIQRLAHPSISNLIKCSSVLCSTHTRTNTAGCDPDALVSLALRPQLNKENVILKQRAKSISSELIPCNIIDQLSCIAQYPQTKIDFKSYYSISTTILDTVGANSAIGYPIHSNVEINDALEKVSIEDANSNNKTAPMKLHKGDLYWRRRRMRRHRLLRWRKRYKKLVLDRLQKRLANREEKQRQDLESAWKTYGLNDEPPKLTQEEIKRLATKWEDQGIIVGLDRDEMLSFRKIEMIRKATDDGT